MLALVAGLPALFGEFVLDDTPAIAESACVRGELGIAELWQRNFWCELAPNATVDAWRPWPVMVWRLLWALGGGQPSVVLPVLHGLGLVLHAAVALVVSRIVADWGRSLGWTPEWIARRSLLAGLAFAAAGVHAEAIASLVASADLWATLATAMVLHLACSGQRGDWITLPVWAAIALLSKETSAVVLVPALALAGLAAHRIADLALRRRMIRATLLVGLVTVAYVGVRWACWGLELDTHTTAMVNPLIAEPWLARLPTALSLLGRSLALTLLGFPLSADYSAHAIEVGVVDGWAALGGVSMIGVAGLLWTHRRSPNPRLAVWAGAYAAWWIVLGHLIVPLPTLFSERLLYGPSVASIVMLAALVPVRPTTNRALTLVVGGWIAIQTLLCFDHSLAWTSEPLITERTVANSPKSARAHIWRARLLLREGDPDSVDEVEHHVDTAIELAPNLALPHAFRAVLLDFHGQPEQALAEFRQAFETDPADPEVADLFIQFLVRYGHQQPAQMVYTAHANARAGQPHPDVHPPP